MAPQYWLRDPSTWLGLLIGCAVYVVLMLAVRPLRASPCLALSASATTAGLLVWPLAVYLKINPVPVAAPLLLAAAVIAGIASVARGEAYAIWLIMVPWVAGLALYLWIGAWRSMM